MTNYSKFSGIKRHFIISHRFFEARIQEGLSQAVLAQSLLGGCSEMITRAQISRGQRTGGWPASLSFHGVSGSLHVVFPRGLLWAGSQHGGHKAVSPLTWMLKAFRIHIPAISYSIPWSSNKSPLSSKRIPPLNKKSDKESVDIF